MSANRGKRRTAVYDLFTCSDGKQVFIGIVSDGQWKRICPALGLDDLLARDDLKHNPGRVEHRPMLLERIAAAAARFQSTVLVDLLVEADVCVAPLHTPYTLLEDRHVQSEGRTLPLQIDKVAGRLPPLPYESDQYKFSVRRSAPAVAGSDTAAILREIGYKDDDIAALAAKSVVAGPDIKAS